MQATVPGRWSIYRLLSDEVPKDLSGGGEGSNRSQIFRTDSISRHLS